MVFIEIHSLLLCLYLELCIPLFKGKMTWLLVDINKLQCEKKLIFLRGPWRHDLLVAQLQFLNTKYYLPSKTKEANKKL